MGKNVNQHLCCLYKKNYLCVTSTHEQRYVRIWDLVFLIFNYLLIIILNII